MTHNTTFLISWEKSDSQLATLSVAVKASESAAVPTAPARTSANKTAAGHKREIPADKVVTTASTRVKSAPLPVNAASQQTTSATARPQVDFAFLRQQVTMEQVLRHLAFFEPLRGRSQQRRGPCPVHGQPTDLKGTFSVHLGKNLCQCFQADCAAQGNVLDLWAASHRLPLYEAALHLAETFHLHRNREEERVKGTR